jgi:tRNA (cytosine34-C5)-methyltransferase
MWPSPDNIDLHLDRCLRFLPHHNDDGGFFVALVRKTKPLPWQVNPGQDETPISESCLLSRRARNNLVGRENKTKIKFRIDIERKNKTLRVGSLWHPKSYFSFLSKGDQELDKVLDFYGLAKKYDADLFYSPTAARNTFYLTNPMLKSILKAENKMINVYHAGAKVNRLK